jgi:carbamoyltransferase
MKETSAGARRRRSPTAWSSAGSRGAWSGVPRALGNHSILCDPRRGDMRAILNAKIKRREPFRPFAPSVLAEAVGQWFEEDDAVPFMMQVYQIREQKRAQIRAVTHVDGSGSLRTVYRHTIRVIIV